MAALLQELSEQDRQGLADLINQLAHQDPTLTAWKHQELWDSQVSLVKVVGEFFR
ncbi:hypothetical protein [Nonomuraea rubra]|uniref:Uncharacterized protein n=1 Tax=Nonomuraea rubra TaxID=46180 RepID=A0A7X0U1E4_9ACTN|nr:hypothetical protein [Nonomuraea rubra]MBB6551295.1 hypothetical protein [Nonomuraea rubra]